MKREENSDNFKEDEEITRIMSRRSEQPIIVMGEASESDEEEIQQHVERSPVKTSNVDNRKSELSTEFSTKKHRERKTLQSSKYQSLLHTKLRERNIHLRRMITDAVHQSYELATNDVNVVSQNLVKAQILVQEVGPTLRQTANELFQLKVKFDSALENCKSLSRIK